MFKLVGQLLTRSTRCTCVLWEKRTDIANEFFCSSPTSRMQQMLITNLIVFSHVSTKMAKVCKFVASLAEARPTVVGSSQISFPPFFPFTDIPENAAKINAKITRKIAKKMDKSQH